MHTNRSEWPRTRPLDTTSGSDQRPARLLAGPALRFDLAAELASLQREASWQQADRNARTLVREPALRIVLLGLKAGARLEEHQAEGQVSFQTLTGRLRLAVSGEAVELSADHLLALAPGVAHDLEALDESAVLLTIAG